ncbi:MAG TPA: chromosome segregation protein SMC, partial [Myxococcaceae bacterium]|nr:chromosome segregation protein SMC [Myxococcaceae bacterium]
GNTSKAALWIVGRDGVTYRILRELGRSGSLYRVNASTRGHDLVTEEPTEMAQFLRAQVGFPPRGRYETLFTFTAGQLPSRRSKRSAGAGGRPGGATPVPETPIDPAQARTRLAELEKELALSSEVERLQFRADGVSAQIFQLETKVKSVQALEQELGEAQRGLQQTPTVESLGLIPDIVERAKVFPALVAKVDETFARLEADRQLDVVKAPTATPLQRDARFWAGMALGAAALFTGATVTGPLKYIALLDIPAFGLAALVALKRIEDLQWAELAVRRGDRLGDRERQVRDQFEADAQPVRNAMKILGVEQPHEIVLALEEHGRWAGKVADLEKRVHAAKLNPEYIAAANQLAELRAEQEALNARLAEKGSYVRDAREVEREMARMREALAPAPRRVSSSGVPAAGGADGLDDFTTVLMSAAADLLTIDVPSLAARIGERCAQYVTVLTERRVEGLEFTYDGQCQARVGGKLIPVGQLLARDVDWVWLGLRLTLLERLVSQEPMPVLLEDMATGMDEARLPMLGRMLKGLGGGTQVLHVTAHPVFASLSDGSLNV